MVLDQNTFPYYDDYDETKNYYKILFRPGYAVQARELTQIQTQIQKQIERFGKHVFKEGSMVIPGEIALDNKYAFLKLQDEYNAEAIAVSNFLNKKIVGTTSGAIATVLDTVEIDGLDPNTLYLKYETGDSSQTFTGSITNGSSTITGISISATSKLTQGAVISGTGIPANSYIIEIISASSVKLNNAATATNVSASLTITTASVFEDDEHIITIESDEELQLYEAQTALTSATGFGSKTTIKEGVYFALGYFCFVEEQTLILDKYTNTPSYKVGIRILDEFIDENDDISLVDPAQGSPNFNAPGADRYKISLTLSKYDLTEELPTNFVELIRVNAGNLEKFVTRPEYSELEKTLARRTFDESGDYTVRAFPLFIKEHLNDGTNFGVYSVSNGGDETKIVYSLDQGKAYVKGFEIESIAVTNLEGDKARETLTRNNYVIPSTIGSYIDVDNVTGTFDITTYEEVNLKNVDTAVIGTARVKGFTLYSGTAGSPSAIYRVHLFDIFMDSDSNGTIPFSNVRTIDATGKSADVVLVDGNAVLNDIQNSVAIIKIPEYAIKTFKDEVDNVDTSYTVRRYLTGTLVGNSVTFTAGTNETFNSFNILDYHVSIDSASGTATGNGYTDSDVIDLTAVGNSVTLGGSPTGKQVTITIPDIADSSIEVIATITKSIIAEKTKALTSRTQTIAHSNTVQLDKADIYQIVSITDATSLEDITDRYTLDNGQRDTYYDRGRLIFSTDYAAPVGNITVAYEYFTHGSGDYFSVDSYDGVIDYNDIPTYFSQTTGDSFDLINCLDFRPRMNDAGTGFASTSEVVANGEELQCDYTYYVGRIDKIVLDTSGNFSVVKGASGVIPLSPKDPENSLVLYEVSVPPYTFSTKDIYFKQIDNKRYTMRDIGKLESRIENLEYYTTLSLLEKDTASLFIDDGTGGNRFKNGFVVDNFRSHLVGNGALSEYQCSVDPSSSTLRPPFSMENVDIEIDVGSSSNYTQTGVLVSLPYTHVSLINQPFSSKTENVNPYNVFAWIGNVSLSPNSDDWFETTQLPDIIIKNEDSLANAMATLNGSTVWDEWTTTWTGASVSLGRSTGAPTFNLPRGDAHAQWEWRSWATESLRRAGIPLDGVQGIRATGRAGNFRFTGTVTELTSTQVGQTRSGARLTVVPGAAINEVLEDKVVDSAVIQWMRSKEVEFTATNLKPNTRVYPFFDGVPVVDYCKPSDVGAVDGDPLITNTNGNISGTFTIPNNDTIRFRTGQRNFELMDSLSGNKLSSTTLASGMFTASGFLQTKQATIQSTIQPEIVRNALTESRTTTITETTSRTVTGAVMHVDPIAQTFLIDNADGVFLSKINIFFASKDENGIPVRLQIRNVVNGVPGQFVVPFSDTTLNPESVNISDDATEITTFTFSSPVYLQGNTEYCFVLLSNSNSYNAWCSVIGEFDVTTGERISQQPYTGVMFKSSNASTWTPSQEQDIKFEIFRCSFNTNVQANILYKNDVVPTIILPLDPFSTIDSTSTITVFHPNHGLLNGDTVTYSGITGTPNGMDSTDLNTTFITTYVDFDHYTIDLDSNMIWPDKTGVCGGSTVLATRNLRTDVLNVIAQHMVFPNTLMDWGLKTRNEAGTLSTSYAFVNVERNIDFDSPQLILSADNDPGTKSVHLLARMETDTDFLSPVIDTTRNSVIAISNRINNTDVNETNAESGLALARYITKKITLAEGASAIRVYFAALRPVNATIRVYIKYQTDDNQSSIFEDLDYTELVQVDYPVASDTEFRDHVFELDNLEPYSVFSIKIVMMSAETSDIPLIRDFRAIAIT
jgi:hypothetical protein